MSPTGLSEIKGTGPHRAQSEYGQPGSVAASVSPLDTKIVQHQRLKLFPNKHLCPIADQALQPIFFSFSLMWSDPQLFKNQPQLYPPLLASPEGKTALHFKILISQFHQFQTITFFLPFVGIFVSLFFSKHVLLLSPSCALLPKHCTLERMKARPQNCLFLTASPVKLEMQKISFSRHFSPSFN